MMNLSSNLKGLKKIRDLFSIHFFAFTHKNLFLIDIINALIKAQQQQPDTQ